MVSLVWTTSLLYTYGCAEANGELSPASTLPGTDKAEAAIDVQYRGDVWRDIEITLPASDEKCEELPCGWSFLLYGNHWTAQHIKNRTQFAARSNGSEVSAEGAFRGDGHDAEQRLSSVILFTKQLLFAMLGLAAPGNMEGERHGEGLLAILEDIMRMELGEAFLPPEDQQLLPDSYAEMKAQFRESWAEEFREALALSAPWAACEPAFFVTAAIATDAVIGNIRQKAAEHFESPPKLPAPTYSDLVLRHFYALRTAEYNADSYDEYRELDVVEFLAALEGEIQQCLDQS